jgi:hypothetical protein
MKLRVGFEEVERELRRFASESADLDDSSCSGSAKHGRDRCVPKRKHLL